ncbi:MULTISPECIES: ROK family protein [unclassified Lactococcus]|uniref:ROK family protein n=1 Tax=unclassified Lactococcus TaxID=2643510 RepID=UPI0011CC9E63|nr:MULTISPECIES: ROK family protein [unclassified Lactococcus]MQW23166.1 ROK family protein [Lactococcus sp. dk101]TXK44218.1 ROK family protein [Lactococcus sp. dk310]TXK49949.1 ROK family protein [Lactococcus sp. dk322]
MSLLTIDIGGTSIKSAVFTTGKLSENESFKTPATLDVFYERLTALVSAYKEKYDLEGVAISAPGAVNKQTGVIEGASALPYIHHFNIHQELEKRFGLPISIENDANCAALAEVEFGVAKGLSNVLFLVLGTGVGGSVVMNGKVHHGKHLFGGEFGFMIMDDEHTFSELGTTVRMEDRYTQRTGTKLTAIEIFDLAFSGDPVAKSEMDIFTFNVAKGIYNLQYSFDPELIIIGGGVSQADWLIPELEKQLSVILERVGMAPFMPKLAVCHYRNNANLIGAAVDFKKTYEKD